MGRRVAVAWATWLLVLYAVPACAHEVNVHQALTGGAVRIADNLASTVQVLGLDQEWGATGLPGRWREELRSSSLDAGLVDRFLAETSRMPRAEALIRAGSMLEDTHGWYWNHFFQPLPETLRGRALWGNGIPALYVDTRTWAMNDPDNPWSYQRLQARLQALASVAGKSDWRERWEEILLNLGCLLHLVQDMTSPAHTRNDGHPPFDSDPFESWGRQFGEQHVPAFNLLSHMARLDESIVFLARQTVANFYSKNTIWEPQPFQVPGFPDLGLLERIDSACPGLSDQDCHLRSGLVVNRSLASASWMVSPTLRGVLTAGSTRFAGGVPIAEWIVPKQHLADCGCEPTQLLLGGCAQPSGPSNCPHNAKENAVFIPASDGEVMRSHAEMLYGWAIDYSAAVINYVFRGQIEIEDHQVMPQAASGRSFRLLVRNIQESPTLGWTGQPSGMFGMQFPWANHQPDAADLQPSAGGTSLADCFQAFLMNQSGAVYSLPRDPSPPIGVETPDVARLAAYGSTGPKRLTLAYRLPAGANLAEGEYDLLLLFWGQIGTEDGLAVARVPAITVIGPDASTPWPGFVSSAVGGARIRTAEIGEVQKPHQTISLESGADGWHRARLSQQCVPGLTNKFSIRAEETAWMGPGEWLQLEIRYRLPEVAPPPFGQAGNGIGNGLCSVTAKARIGEESDLLEKLAGAEAHAEEELSGSGATTLQRCMPNKWPMEAIAGWQEAWLRNWGDTLERVRASTQAQLNDPRLAEMRAKYAEEFRKAFEPAVRQTLGHDLGLPPDEPGGTDPAEDSPDVDEVEDVLRAADDEGVRLSPGWGDRCVIDVSGSYYCAVNAEDPGSSSSIGPSDGAGGSVYGDPSGEGYGTGGDQYSDGEDDSGYPVDTDGPAGEPGSIAGCNLTGVDIEIEWRVVVLPAR